MSRAIIFGFMCLERADRNSRQQRLVNLNENVNDCDEEQLERGQRGLKGCKGV